MWDIANQTPYAAGWALTTDPTGADVWVVAVKGTFAIAVDGRLKVADKQEPVLMMPVYRGDPVTSSLIYESDLDFPKRTTDVLVNGHAYAPSGRSCTEVSVIVRVGAMEKRLVVHGDRVWQGGLVSPTLSEPVPFDRMPVVYERAFGGIADGANPAKPIWEPRNPVGTGLAATAASVIGVRAPNIEAPGQSIGSWKDKVVPIGFGAVARHWRPRVQYAGTYDSTWQRDRFPLLPADFDTRFFQCAPEDQQTPQFLKGNEQVELHNLTPDGYLSFLLPRETIGFRTRIGSDLIEHRGSLYTVIIEPDHPRVIMVWVSGVPCHGKKYRLQRTVVLQKKLMPRSSAPSVARA